MEIDCERMTFVDSLLFAVNALAPLLFVALIGYVLSVRGFFSKTFIEHLNRYIFYVALPVLIFVTIIGIDDVRDIEWRMIGFAVAMLLVITLLGLLFVAQKVMRKPYKPVVMQAFYRGNFMLIGIPLASRLGGVEALAILAILNAFMVPIANFLSIVTFKVFQKESQVNPFMFTDLMKTTMKNPLMLAIFAGLIVLIFNATTSDVIGGIPVVADTLDMIAMTATPMALIAVGGQFRLKRVKVLREPLIYGVVARMVFVPTIVLGSAYLLRNTIDFTNAWAALIAVFASPIAVSSVAVTKELGGDDELASQLVIWTTGLAVISLFIIVVLFRGANLL